MEAAERQKRRQEQLRKYCLDHGSQQEPKKDELENLLVDDENKIIYCTIAKVASTPWKMVLMRLRNNTKVNITETSVHTPSFWKHLSELSQEDRSKRLATHFKFLFVREPLHRILSAYKDKFWGKNRVFTNQFRQSIVRAFRPEDEQVIGVQTNNVTFSEFLQYISTSSNKRVNDSHWHKYEQLCFPCFFKFDFIGSFETLKDDAAFLLKMTGMDNRVRFPRVRPSSASSDFKAGYSGVPYDVVLKFANSRRSDFEMFGYPFPGTLKDIITKV